MELIRFCVRKNPDEKLLALFSGSTCCDLGHGRHAALLLVPETETSQREDPASLAVSFMMTFKRQFA